jgi:hypothetical protein
MVLGFVTDEVFSQLIDSLGEKIINLLGRTGIVDIHCHRHPNGEIRQDIE